MKEWHKDCNLGLCPCLLCQNNSVGNFKGIEVPSLFFWTLVISLLPLADGFSVKTVKGMLYNPLFRTWSWTGNTSINYALHAVKCSVQEQSDSREAPLETDKE